MQYIIIGNEILTVEEVIILNEIWELYSRRVKCQ